MVLLFWTAHTLLLGATTYSTLERDGWNHRDSGMQKANPHMKFNEKAVQPFPLQG